MMKRTDICDGKRLIVESGEKTLKSERHEVYDAYHDESYIISHDCRKIVSLSEKGENRVYRLMNDVGHELVVMRVDGGIFDDSTNSKCDFAIYSEKRILILVELKGADYSHALDQLDVTINEMIAKRQIGINKLYTRVVLSKSRIPNTMTSKEIALKRKLKRYGGSHEKQTRLMQEKLSCL